MERNNPTGDGFPSDTLETPIVTDFSAVDYSNYMSPNVRHASCGMPDNRSPVVPRNAISDGPLKLKMDKSAIANRRCRQQSSPRSLWNEQTRNGMRKNTRHTSTTVAVTSSVTFSPLSTPIFPPTPIGAFHTQMFSPLTSPGYFIHQNATDLSSKNNVESEKAKDYSSTGKQIHVQSGIPDSCTEISNMTVNLDNHTEESIP